MANDFVRQLQRPGSGLYGLNPRWQRVHLDVVLLLMLLAFMASALFIIYSASGQSSFYLERQATWYGIGFVVMLITAQIPPRLLSRWAILPYLGGIMLLVGVIFFGTGAKGAQRWLEVAGIRFQPSEIMKIAVPLMVASYLGRRILPPSFKHVIWSSVLIFLPPVLVVVQPDLGTALLVGAAGFFVLFLAGLPMRYLASVAALAAIVAPVYWHFLLRDYQKTRIITLFNPEEDKLGAGWNIIQSTTAIGSGGWNGKGWMQGTQSQLDFLPESHTDFIVAVLAEDFGFVGILVLLACYLMIITRCMIISLRAQSMFGRLLAGSLTLTFFVYVFVNMGMVSGILPVVGVPLPLVSYGGTSIVTLMMGFGMVMAIATEKKRER